MTNHSFDFVRDTTTNKTTNTPEFQNLTFMILFIFIFIQIKKSQIKDWLYKI